LFTGPILGLFAYILLPEGFQNSQGEFLPLTHAAHATAAVGCWMAVWWMTEAIPVYATALLPLALLPLFGAMPFAAAATPYSHKLIFMFMGGFILALSMERWNLHRRIALNVLRLVGTQPRYIIGGFMGVTAFLSMWVSNTATVVMMLPVAQSVIHLVARKEPSSDARTQSEKNFEVCLLLGVAASASIGGIATLVGTPPNLFMASFIETQLGQEIGFAQWMQIGLPFSLVLLGIAWLLLTRFLYPVASQRIEGGHALLVRSYQELGAMNRGAWITSVVFVLTASGWIFRPYLEPIQLMGVRPFAGLGDEGIAMLAALLLFCIPVDLKHRIFTMDWETAVRLPWGTLLLFGGGLSLASAVNLTGVDVFIGHQVGAFGRLPDLGVVLLVTILVMFLTELTSNTATVATFLPILASIAPAMEISPYMLVIPATIAASCAFMLPVATPPNAIVFGTGGVSIFQMCKAGICLNLCAVVLILLLAGTFVQKFGLLG